MDVPLTKRCADGLDFAFDGRLDGREDHPTLVGGEGAGGGVLPEYAGFGEAVLCLGIDLQALGGVAVGAVGGEEDVDIDGGILENARPGEVEELEHVGVFGREEAARGRTVGRTHPFVGRDVAEVSAGSEKPAGQFVEERVDVAALVEGGIAGLGIAGGEEAAVGLELDVGRIADDDVEAALVLPLEDVAKPRVPQEAFGGREGFVGVDVGDDGLQATDVSREARLFFLLPRGEVSGIGL